MASTLEHGRLRVPRPALLLAAVLVACVSASEVADARQPVSLEVRHEGAQPDPAASVLQGVARLQLQGGDPRIGGFSSILRLPEPERLLLATDRGHLVDALLSFDDGGGLRGLAGAHIQRFPLSPTWSDDVEAMAVVDGRLLITTEGTARLPDRIITLDGPVGEPAGVAEALAVTGLGLRPNRGFEALVDLPGGGWLAVAETRIDGVFPALLHDGRRLDYVATDGFAPTGADRLGNRLFFVERSLSLLGGWRARITCLAVDALAEAGPLRPIRLAQLGIDDAVDNMEGIAVWQRGEDVEILIVSDDNFSALQRTLLLHYRWPGGASGGCGPSSHQEAEG